MTLDEIKQVVEHSLSDLFNKDLILLQNDVSERAITHKLAEYIQKRIPYLHVDCEYNRDATRNNTSPKLIYIKEKTKEEVHKAIDNDDDDVLISISTYPDIIVHRRGTNDRNLLVVEVKKKNSRVGSEHDKLKLYAFTQKSNRNLYNFTYGVFICLETAIAEPRILECEWFGEEF